MSFFRVSNPVASDFQIADLGITIAASASNVVLSNQFSIDDLYLSADLESAIINGDLTVQIDYGTGFSSVAAIDYTNRDALAAFLNVYEITNENNNEKLVNGSDVTSALHMHDNRYFTETELSATGGAALIGVNDTTWVNLDPATTVQQALNNADALFNTAVTLDAAYDNDSDGILDVDGVTKDLNLRSNNVNDVLISRKSGADEQNALQLDVSANELILGKAAVGALAELDVRVKTDLFIEGNLTVTGTVTDTTVDTLNVTNANIRLRDGATAIAGADAYIEVERGTSGADARLLWNETSDRWQAGIVGDMATIALLEKFEQVTGVWTLIGSATTDPSIYFKDKAAAPTTNLGDATQIPVTVITNIPAYYDKTRTKFLSMYRKPIVFQGRDNSNNSNEYARISNFTSNQSSVRLIHNMTLIGISAQTNGAETWTARVRKNGSLTNLASLVLTAVAGAQDDTLNVDFNAGDVIELFIDGTSVDRPTIELEFAQRF